MSPRDFVRVCKAAHGFDVGRDVKAIDADPPENAMVRLSYTRDDGKLFRYDCIVEGRIIHTRMIDEAGPGTGPGAWSGRGSTITFELKPGSVSLKQVFVDGSTDEGVIKI